MEYVEAALAIIGILKDKWSSISRCFNYHKILDKNVTSLQEKMERLKSREQDVTIELQNAQYHRKIARKEVENWLLAVQKMKDEMERLEKEAGKRRCFSRLEFLKDWEENIAKVNELVEESNFSHGILIDVKDEGTALSTKELIGETTAKRNLERIWTCLEKDEVQSIGVWGMGGIGKTTMVTHIHNRLLEKKGTFGLVYWLTVSKDSSIHKLQDTIAWKINLDLSQEQDEMIRPALLCAALRKEKKFVLIFDDMWEVYPPEEIGIPIEADSGTLIITSRSRDVCLQMGCQEIIKVESLHKEEAWELFNKTLKRHTALNKKEEDIAKDIVKECAGLPLAIVTTARSLSVVYDLVEWRNALNELREHVKGHTIDMENRVFKILEFSYHRLNDDEIRECLLYCVLYPEDFEIKRIYLIRYWIAEGLIEEMRSRQAQRDRGHAILNKLENVCLLERRQDGKTVRMHDVIRDMAINTARKNSRFWVKTLRNKVDFPSEMVWSNNLERASFFGSELSKSMFGPNYPKLRTLFLRGTGLHEGLQNSFFIHTVSLRVLDLSYTSISSLPDSLYDLVNLRCLLLCGCKQLKHVGSLANLKELRELDFRENQMEAIPDGVENLVRLKYFSWTYKYLRRPEARAVPYTVSNLLPNLVHLQYLNFNDKRFVGVGAEELSGLTNLEILSVNFSSLHNFNSYMRTQHYCKLTHYHVRLNIAEPGYRIGTVGHRNVFSKEVRLNRYIWIRGKDNDDYQTLIIPTNVKLLAIGYSVLPTSLLDVSPSFKMATDLKECWIQYCKGIEYLWWAEDRIASLDTLYLEGLASLRVLFKLRRRDIGRSCWSGLKHLEVSSCGNLKHLFTPELVKYHLRNLQTIFVSRCSQMEEIIAGAAVEVEEEGEESMNETNDLILYLPNLQSLWLDDLQQLKSIWKGWMNCDSLQQLKVMKCPNLRRFPFTVQMSKGGGEGGRRAASIPPLNTIRGETEWWNGVEWDTHPDAKSLFQPMFKPMSYSDGAYRRQRDGESQWYEPSQDIEEQEVD